ncbi:protein kinase [Streptomyces sp. NPDC006512]|uniref:serine/threonine-protein kinase n=1 Tax=Streptomyces sp. NPDC006512 TaxID=3154307 RepID=UPI0033AD0D51
MRGEMLDGRYRLEGRLGNGGMGEVWSAWDERMGRPVAAKLVAPVPAAHGMDSGQVESRFMAEVRSAGNLPHRHTVTVHDCGEAEIGGRRTLYMVMERLDGRTLAEVFRQSGRVPWYRLVDWAGQIASALAAAHARGVVHRDIKPSNVMLAEDGVVKVLDFGIAKFLGETLYREGRTATGTPVGTPEYMSPEQARGERDVDRRSDLYSLGCLMYHGLTGAPPFRADSQLAVLHRQISEEPAPLAPQVRGLPEELDALVRNLLTKDAGHRPADARLVLAALRRVPGIAGKQHFAWSDEGRRAVELIDEARAMAEAVRRSAAEDSEQLLREAGRTAHLLQAGAAEQLASARAEAEAVRRDLAELEARRREVADALAGLGDLLTDGRAAAFEPYATWREPRPGSSAGRRPAARTPAAPPSPDAPAGAVRTPVPPPPGVPPGTVPPERAAPATTTPGPAGPGGKPGR